MKFGAWQAPFSLFGVVFGRSILGMDVKSPVPPQLSGVFSANTLPFIWHHNSSMVEGLTSFSTSNLFSFSLLFEIFELISQAFPIINSSGLLCKRMACFLEQNSKDRRE